MQKRRGCRGSKHSLSMLAAVVLGLGSTGAQAEGLDLSNPTPRAISVAFENSGLDAPGALDVRYGKPVQGWFVRGPLEGQALVRIPGAQMETVVTNFEPIPGTFSDFVWIFDVATGHVVSASFAGVVKSKVSWGFLATEVETSIMMELATDAPAGFLPPETRFGHVVFEFCVEEHASCQRIEPVPLDRGTGYVNAVGSVRATAIGGLETRSYSPLGEAVFQEFVPIPSVSAGR